MNFKKQISLYLLFLSVPTAYSQQATIRGNKDTREIIFTPHMMTNKTSSLPNTTFSNILGANLSLSAWKLYPAQAPSPQDPIRTSFAIPKDFDSDESLVVDVHLLVNKLSGSGDRGKITVSVCYQDNKSEIGLTSPAHGLNQIVNSNSFTITEPSQDSNLYHIKVSVPLDASLADDCDFAYIAITRTTPSGIEYDQDIYLASVAFRYE